MRRLILLLTLAILAVAFVLAFREAPPPTASLRPAAEVYALRTVPETTATNAVAAVNFDWRGYDTIGEATILLTAVTGVTALMRRYLERRRETGIT